MSASHQPQGVTLVLIDTKGRVRAHASDFERSGYGGFSLLEAQKLRCRRALAREFVTGGCHPDIAGALDNYDAEKVVQALVNNKSWVTTEIIIGHQDEE